MTDSTLIANHRFLSDLTETIVNRVLIAQGKRKGRISRTQAYLKYGTANVRYWVKLGVVTPVKGEARNSVEWYDETQLDLAKTLTK